MSPERKPQHINRPQQFLRDKTEAIVGHVYKSDILNPERISEASDLLASGAGLIIAANHFSKRDTIQVYQIPFMDPALRKINITTAIAEHQKKWYYKYLQGLVHNQIIYIPTEETERRYKEAGKTVQNKSDKMKKYIEKMMDVFSNGEIAVIFPQGHRSSRLYNPKRPNPSTISSIYRAMAMEAKRNRRDIPRFGIMFLGFDAQSDKEYEEMNDSTIRTIRYTVNVGHTYTMDQLLEKAGGNPKKLDDVVYGELETLVSPRYIGQKPSQDRGLGGIF